MVHQDTPRKKKGKDRRGELARKEKGKGASQGKRWGREMERKSGHRQEFEKKSRSMGREKKMGGANRGRLRRKREQQKRERVRELPLRIKPLYTLDAPHLYTRCTQLERGGGGYSMDWIRTR